MRQVAAPLPALADVGGLRGVDHPHDLQLNARRQHVEQSSTSAEEHRDLVDLQLVEHPSFERSLRHIRSMHQHVAVRGGGLGLCHRALDPIGHIRHQWIVSDLGDDRWAGRPGSSHR